MLELEIIIRIYQKKYLNLIHSDYNIKAAATPSGGSGPNPSPGTGAQINSRTKVWTRGWIWKHRRSKDSPFRRGLNAVQSRKCKVQLLVVVVLPDPFRVMEAWRNFTEKNFLHSFIPQKGSGRTTNTRCNSSKKRLLNCIDWEWHFCVEYWCLLALLLLTRVKVLRYIRSTAANLTFIFCSLHKSSVNNKRLVWFCRLKETRLTAMLLLQ